jgi:hypothetical protein
MTDVHSHPAESRSIITRFILKSGIYTCVSTLLVFMKILLHSSRSSSITNVSTFGQPVRTEAPSTINLEKVRSRFEAMKQNRHRDS